MVVAVVVVVVAAATVEEVVVVVVVVVVPITKVFNLCYFQNALQQWQKVLKMISDLFTLSRPFKLTVNLVNFLLSTGIVFLSTSSWKESALFYTAITVLLFNTFMRGLSVVIDIGSSKYLFVSDDDIRIALSWLCKKKDRAGDLGELYFLIIFIVYSSTGYNYLCSYFIFKKIAL